MNGSSSKVDNIGFLLSGVAIIIISLYVLMITMSADQKYSRCTATTNGIVVDFYKEPVSKKSPVYPTDYNYTVDGETYQFSVKLSENDKMDIGDDITVHYNPSNAAECCTDFETKKIKGKYIGSCFGGVFGLAIVIFGIYCLNKKASQPAKEAL